MRVTAYQTLGTDPVVICDSTGSLIHSSSPLDLLDHLRYRQRDTLRVFWDLDAAVAPVLRLLPQTVLESLARFDPDTQFGEHQLYYLPDRMFRVGRTRFYGIRSFWPSSTPDPASLSDLQSRAKELIYTLERCGMPNPSKLTSPIAVFEETELGRQVYSSIPKGYDLSENCLEVLQYAYQCDRREWIGAYQVGHWNAGSIWDYDISAAYSSIAASLLDIRDMDIWKSDTVGPREQRASYGFLRCHLCLDPTAKYIHCSPIMADLSRDLPGNPAGDFGAAYYLTLDELRFVESHDMGRFQLLDGWFLAPGGGVAPRKPFAGIMEQLYSQRGLSALAGSIMKGIANQLVGKLAETRVDGQYGVLRNDIYHSLILEQCRIRVAEFLVQNEILPDELVAVQTDGVRLTRDISLSGNIMGGWRNNGSQPTIVASPYKVYCADKKPGHLTYNHISEMVAAHPLSSYYGRTVKHRTTLRQALQDGDITKVGELVDLPAHLDLNAIPREQNRVFAKLPRTGSALLNNRYQSTPVVLEVE